MQKLLRKFCCILALLTASAFAAPKTQLSGSLLNPDGSGFNGTLYLYITQEAAVTSANSCGGPVQVVPTQALVITIANGTMTQWQVQGSGTVNTGAPKVYGSDCTLPSGVPYEAILRDPQGNKLFDTLWTIQGTTQDIGTLYATPLNPPQSFLNAIPGTGTPTGSCSANSVFIQQDAALGQNLWFCINGSYAQQVGAGGALAIGNTVGSGTAQSVLFVNNSGQLAQDTPNFNYSPTTQTLTVTKLSVANTITGNITGNAGTATTAGALSSTPLACPAGQAMNGILANGNYSSCLAVSSPAGATNEFQTKSSLGTFAGSGLFSNGTQITANIPIVLAADPSVALGAATKQYVDNKVLNLNYVPTNPSAAVTVTMTDATNFNLNDATPGGTGVTFALGTNVNISTAGGTLSFKSPDTNNTISLTNTGMSFVAAAAGTFTVTTSTGNITFQPGTSAFINLDGKLLRNTATISANATVGAAGEQTDLVNATSAAVTMTLPAANSGTGTSYPIYSVIKTDSSANAVTITAGAGDTINGTASYSISTQYGVAELTSDGVHNWAISSVSAGVGAGISALSGDVTATGPGSAVATLKSDYKQDLIICVIDGAGSTPAPGAKCGPYQVDYPGTITGWTLLGDVSGSASMTVYKTTYTSYPTTSSIVASAPPNMVSAVKNTSTTLTGWTTTFSSGDIFTWTLDSVSTLTRLTLLLQVTRN